MDWIEDKDKPNRVLAEISMMRVKNKKPPRIFCRWAHEMDARPDSLSSGAKVLLPRKSWQSTQASQKQGRQHKVREEWMAEWLYVPQEQDQWSALGTNDSQFMSDRWFMSNSASDCSILWLPIPIEVPRWDGLSSEDIDEYLHITSDREQILRQVGTNRLVTPQSALYVERQWIFSYCTN